MAKRSKKMREIRLEAIVHREAEERLRRAYRQLWQVHWERDVLAGIPTNISNRCFCTFCLLSHFVLLFSILSHFRLRPYFCAKTEVFYWIMQKPSISNHKQRQKSP